MRIRNVDNNWDWKFGQSQTDYVQNEYAVALDIKMKLQEWYQDCFFAKENGIPWDIRMGYKNQKELLDKDILRVAQNVQGVLNIFNFESSVNNRHYTCKFYVYTQYSTDAQPVEFSTGNF